MKNIQVNMKLLNFHFFFSIIGYILKNCIFNKTEIISRNLQFTKDNMRKLIVKLLFRIYE